MVIKLKYILNVIKLLKVLGLNESKQIDISHFETGFYVVEVIYNNSSISTKKLLVL